MGITQKICKEIVPTFHKPWSAFGKRVYIWLTQRGIVPTVLSQNVLKHINDGRALYSPFELQVLIDCLWATMHLKGDIAEVGVFRGGTAVYLCENRGPRQVHLFDTFKGIPSVSHKDPNYKVGDFASTEEDVAKYIDKQKNDGIFLRKGVFPPTDVVGLGGTLRMGQYDFQRWSLVHLDVDTYDSTYNCLVHFDNWVVQGGIIVVHDYDCASGVMQAVHAFLDLYRDRFIKLPMHGGTQCVLIRY